METSFPTEGSWHIHHVVSSSDPMLRQWNSRYAIHASHLLSDEVLRYLKRVRVTPALY